MCRAAGSPALELLQCPAEVLEDLAVDEFDLTARRKDRDQPWNAVHDQARLAFAFAQRVLGELPLVDVRQQHAPANDPAACIAQRKAVVLEPPVHAVRPPQPLHDLVWIARADRLREDVDDVRKVFRVHGAVRAPTFQLLQRLSGVFEDVVIDESTSPPDVKSATRPGMLSTTRRAASSPEDWRGASVRTAELAPS